MEGGGTLALNSNRKAAKSIIPVSCAKRGVVGGEATLSGVVGFVRGVVGGRSPPAEFETHKLFSKRELH